MNKSNMKREYSLAYYGRIYNPPNWFYNPAYVINRIYYIVSGTAYYMDNIPLKPGYLYIFNASPKFKVSQSKDDPVDHVYFDFFTYRKLISSDYIEINPESNPMLLNQLKAIAKDWSSAPYYDHIADAYLDILIYYLEDYLTSGHDYSEITSTMLQLIHNIPVNELSVNEIALRMNRNVNHLIRCFKKDIGITPHKYIAKMKVNLAIAYKLQGMTKTEIAEKLGFGSLSAFLYFFRTETNKTY